MAQLISALPINALVKDINTLYYGKPIIWSIKAKNHTGYPSNSVTLMSEYILAVKCFDAKEDNNTNGNRRYYGNNRYSVSNLLQWANSAAAAGQWYSEQHSADAPPSAANVSDSYNPYETEAGFLNGFSENMRNALLNTTVTVVLNTAGDGGGSEQVTSKVFLASTTEIGLANENDIAEGALLAGFSADKNSRLAYPTAEAVANSNYTVNSFNPGAVWGWWLRTPYASYSQSVRHVHSSGVRTENRAFIGTYGFRPLCNLPSEILVSDSPDLDGVYIIKWREPPVISGIDTNLGNIDSSPSYNYTVADEVGDIATVIERLDGTTLRTYTPTLGTTNTLSISAADWIQVLNGGHTITITAANGTGETVRTLTFTKAKYNCMITLPQPIPVSGSVIVTALTIMASIPADSIVKIEVTNNAKDANPVWEDATIPIKKGLNYAFRNKQAVNGFAYNFRFSVTRSDGGSGGYITQIKGGFQ